MQDAIDTTTPYAPTPMENHHFFMLNLARSAASKSRDPSTQVGCVLAAQIPEQLSSLRSNATIYTPLGSGYNRFPPGVELTPNRLNSRPDKYMFTVHAERAALNNLLENTLRGGPRVATSQIVAYIWGMSPCIECIKDLRDAGIRTIFYHLGTSSDEARARYSINPTAQAIINEGGMRVVSLDHIELGAPFMFDAAP